MWTRHRTILGCAIVLLLVGGSFVPYAKSASNPTLVYSGLNFPVSFRFAPDGRIFFNEKNTGNIRIIQGGSVLVAPFATLAVAIDGLEQGLLGLALDPAFSVNGFVYVYYTYSDGSYYHGRITRFTATGNTGVDPLNIFDVRDPSPATTNHNGGYLRFGPDGKLFVQVGEFADSNQAQNLTSNAGKILRMNPDGSIPSDNPFVGSLVYAYGIRNGFGMDFDPNDGKLVETEAGPASDDQINIIQRGRNYGWPYCLGVCNNPAYVDPIATFTPVVTPTGIAYASLGVFYFGEWTGVNLQKLTLTSSNKMDSIQQIWSLGTPNNGVLDVVLGPDKRFYLSTATGIYAYNIPVTLPPHGTTPSLLETVFGNLLLDLSIVAATVAIAGLITFRWKKLKAQHA